MPHQRPTNLIMANSNTITNSSTDETTETTQHPTIFRLPAELRLQIYDMLFASLSDIDPTTIESEVINSRSILYTSHDMFDDVRETFIRYKDRLDQITRVMLDRLCQDVAIECRRICRDGVAIHRQSQGTNGVK